ncbi:dihydrodipicolinate synthase family protein [Haloquadratum walsbyi]|jgi:Dihydrodipicolinate synthase/N-acetylneuraminate lyase|uniref:Dihydrodipicolinate synthase/N-acetylneuraminate lyase n=1 Tax=Haloquadratum walsbyi J07HQW2 TaxID=1238425 RepID=U1PQC4_9EURY|nr:dihydrodipicolinate synthase family protein [Haloquadratum walsbyi]ERG94526.1 MAG: dihydrodipicolinate synthase/N-acetylneuraminate lyase [Haloquadratum walsbyi J07HQW2]
MSGSYTRSVLCPIVTPFTSGDDNDTNVDHAGLRSVIEFVSDAGIDGIIPCGTTGEFASLTTMEYRAVIDTAVDATNNIPACTGQQIEPQTVATLAEHDDIIGLKDSGGDFDYILEVLSKTDSSFHAFEGYDRHYVSGVHAGTAGGINALANVLPERFDTIRNTAFRGDTQTALEIEQSALAPLFDFCVEYGMDLHQ